MAPALAFATSALACGQPFTSPALVEDPRVLAIVAEAPTVEPGATITLSPIVGGARSEGSFRWTLCVRTESASTGLPLSSFGAFEPERGCESRSAIELASPSDERAPSFVIPAGLFEDERVLRTAFGEGLSSVTLRSLADRAGVTVIASVRWSVDGVTTTAFKRVLVRRGERNTNPPPPVVRVMGRELRRPAGALDERCEFVDGMGPMRVVQGARVLFEPDPDESWAESFTILDASGNLVQQQETAFRNWFSTAGQWDFGRSRSPDLNPTWVAPKRAGDVTLWLVLRDGHGGTSACRWVARVE
jgi:hypothetical protein